MSNTLILVDYDNVFITLKNNYRDYRNPNIMYDVIAKIKEKYKSDNVLSCRLFADFQKVQISEAGYEILRKAHVEIEHVFNGKNASDVILMINCMKYMMQYPHIDKIVLVSSDSDLVPIFHEVKLLNKELEVLYFELNTGEEHIRHMEEADIKHQSIEELLGISIYQTYATHGDFYRSKVADKVFWIGMLEQINGIIRDLYNIFLQTDCNGNVINAGITRIPDLADAMRSKGVCPDCELKKSPVGGYGNILNMLQAENILVRHAYTMNGKQFNTLILSETYLNGEGIIIPDLVKDSDFPNT